MRRKYTKENLRLYWEIWLKEYGKQPTAAGWDRERGHPCTSTIIKYYGTWNNFVKETGGVVIGYPRVKLKEVGYCIGECLEAYLQYVNKRKAEGNKPTTLQGFFNKYDFETLKPLKKGCGPLYRYVGRYQREMRRLEEKVE